jgi:hypothetical protein
MDFLGLPITQQSLAGQAAQADRTSPARDPKKPQKPSDRFKRAGDSLDLAVTETEAAEAVRDTKGNDQEEAHEDRQQHGLDEIYTQRGRPTHEEKPRLDLKG